MKIKSTIIVATAAGAAFAPNAAEAQSRSAGPGAMAAPVFTWTGFYVGGHLGYAWQKNPTSGAYVDFATTWPYAHSNNPRGFAGGAQIGYNWQSGSIVYGLETDISVLSGKGTQTSFPTGDPSDSTVTSNSRIEWVGTLRGRLGVSVMPRTIIYGTGGLAYGRVLNELVQNEGGPVSYFTASKVKTGYAVGGGIEHAITDYATIRLEGLFVDLGKQTLTQQTSGVCGFVCTPVSFKNSETTLRAGVNVRF
jgi:outer membrane immunogenic protein